MALRRAALRFGAPRALSRGGIAGAPARAAGAACARELSAETAAAPSYDARDEAASGSGAEAGASGEPGARAATPGEADAARFVEGESVAFWRSWQPPPLAPQPAALAAAASEVLAEARDAAGAAYMAYHAARTAFFAAQGAAGLLAAGQAAHPLTGAKGSAALAAAARLVAEAAATYRQDLGAIRAGVYGLPWDMSPQHRQFSPAFVADRGVRFLKEAAATLRRRDAAASGAEAAPLWLRSPMYPEYYLSAWHHQSDGWLSPGSAAVYDASTESLFIGRQDAMQRAALGLLCRHLRGDAAGDAGAPPSDDAATAPRVLDVAAGTGRFLTFVRDEFPAAEATALDLSPFYLAEARDANAHWEQLRGGGRHGAARYVQAAAEAMPFPDASFDAVTCVYLFHELPPAARGAVAAEIARVLRPGGVAVLADSVQLGDRPALDAGLGRFGDFNEPNYRSYIELDLGALFAQAGLRPARKEVRSVTKALSFVKPHAAAAA